MANPSPDLTLASIDGPAQALRHWLTMFDLALVAFDPVTKESTWLLPTAARILSKFREADCRVAWLVAGDADDCRDFLGEYQQGWLTFADPDRTAVKGFGIERLPALVRVRTDGSLAGLAQGWNPTEWREVVNKLAKDMAWIPPVVPAVGDPPPFEGAPAFR